jgi:pimeloyl-ACP methyl ester carboxylesterase
MAIMKKGLSFILTGSLLAGAVITADRYHKAIRAARDRLTGLNSQVIETACGPVEYVRVGEGHPVLSVHGAMGGFDQGLWLAQAFNLTKYQVISVSRFGYLRSPVPPVANLDMQADAFAALLDALDIQQAAVFAVSGGSTSAIRFAARHPSRVSALILLGPDAPGKVQMPLPPRFVFDSLLRSDFLYWAMVTWFGKWVQDSIGLVPKGYRLTPEQQAQIKAIQAGDLPASRRIDGMIFETYTCEEEYRQSVTSASPYPLNQIKTPVLVINAADDPISIPENVHALASQMPNARLFFVPDGGHFLFGHAAEARAEIAQFLREQVLRSSEMERHNEENMP